LHSSNSLIITVYSINLIALPGKPNRVSTATAGKIKHPAPFTD
jgi:hypothetical protein